VKESAMGKKNYIDDDAPEIPEYIREMMKTGEIADRIVLDREGNWHHNGEPFTNKKIIDFFNKSVNISIDGHFVLHYSNYTYPIEVEDVAVFITGVRFEGFGSFERVIMNLTTGQTDELDPDTLYYRQNNALYCSVLGGKFQARFMRSPSFHILDRLDEIEGSFYLTICGKRIKLEKRK